jgi:hypothetical protein
MNYYATCKLLAGTKVTVLGEHDKDWLAIEPPKPGEDSFSWIHAQNVRVEGLSALVMVPEAPVRIGSRLYKQQPTVEQLKVKQGTQLTVIGKCQISGEGAWLPILPPPREVRYIPASAVKTDAVVRATTSAPPLAKAPILGDPGVAPSSPTSDNLRVKAELAVQAGNFGDAIRFYEALAQQTHDQNLKIECLNRSQFLRDATKSSQATLARSTPADNRGSAASSGAAAPVASYYPAARRTGPNADSSADTSSSVKLRPPVLNNPPASPSAAVLWYGPAVLRPTSFSIDGRPAYRLEPVNGVTWWYATAGPGVDLAPFLGRTLQVAGQMSYRTDRRLYYMSVVQINVVR